MIGLFIVLVLVGIASAVCLICAPSGDKARLAAARRELRKSGRAFERGSEEEAGALRVLLDGDSLDQYC